MKPFVSWMAGGRFLRRASEGFWSAVGQPGTKPRERREGCTGLVLKKWPAILPAPIGGNRTYLCRFPPQLL